MHLLMFNLFGVLDDRLVENPFFTSSSIFRYIYLKGIILCISCYVGTYWNPARILTIVLGGEGDDFFRNVLDPIDRIPHYLVGYARLPIQSTSHNLNIARL